MICKKCTIYHRKYLKKCAKCGKIFLKLYHRYVDILCDTRSITINFQGGMTMRRLFTQSKKVATLALATVMAVATAFGVAKVAWAGSEAPAETPIVTKVQFNLLSEELTVKDYQGESVADEGTYYFYTTDKVSSKKIPAANKWKRTNDGTVSTETISKKKTLYFAKTTTPAYDDVVAVEVPNAAKVKSAKYNAPKNEWTINTNTNAADKFITISAGNDSMSLEAFKATNSDGASTRESFVNSMYGQTVDVYIAPVGTDGDVLKSEGDTSNMVAKLTADANTGVYKFPEKAVRGSVYSTSKRVKVGNRAGGPAVTIDYANHCIKVASTTEVANVADIQTPSDFKTTIASADESVLTSGKTVYYFFNDEAKAFDVRTKATDKKIASMDTPVAVPVTKEFGANASIIGGFEKDAFLEIAPKVKGENSSSVSYQYVVLDKAKYEKVVKNNKFDYKTAMGEKLAWKTIKYTVDKNGNAKNATAKIINSKTTKTDKTIKEGGVVLVREAGSANKPSSKVMIFTVPTETEPYWTSKKIGAYEATNEVSVSPVTVEGTNLVFTVYNGKDKVTTETVKDKITLNRTAATVTAASVAETEDVKVTISVPDTLKKDSVDLTVAAKAGFITDSTYTFSYKLTKADVKVPSIASATDGAWVVADDKKSAKVTLTVQLSENIAKNKGTNEKPEYAALDAGDIKEFFTIPTDNYTLNKATYTKATSKKKANIVFELTYDLTKADSVAGKITYAASKSLYDATGHALSIGADGIAIKADSSAKEWVAPAA